jgi:hypothetical protein
MIIGTYNQVPRVGWHDLIAHDFNNQIGKLYIQLIIKANRLDFYLPI